MQPNEIRELYFLQKLLVDLNSAYRQLAGLQTHAFVADLLARGKYLDPKNLNRHERQVFSRTGQDGVIAEIFRRIATTSRYFLEIGAGNGLESNTAFLLFQGGRGSWIDGGDKEIASIRANFREPIASGKLAIAQEMVTAENVEAILTRLAVPTEFDLLSLDVDRNTYWVWKALKKFKPRVVVVEYNSIIPPDVEWVAEYRADLSWNKTQYFGAGLKSLEMLGNELGYSLVGCELVGTDAFFVRSDLCKDHFVQPFTAEMHYEPSRHFLWPMRGSMHERCFSDL